MVESVTWKEVRDWARRNNVSVRKIKSTPAPGDEHNPQLKSYRLGKGLFGAHREIEIDAFPRGSAQDGAAKPEYRVRPTSILKAATELGIPVDGVLRPEWRNDRDLKPYEEAYDAAMRAHPSPRGGPLNRRHREPAGEERDAQNRVDLKLVDDWARQNDIDITEVKVPVAPGDHRGPRLRSFRLTKGKEDAESDPVVVDAFPVLSDAEGKPGGRATSRTRYLVPRTQILRAATALTTDPREVLGANWRNERDLEDLIEPYDKAMKGDIRDRRGSVSGPFDGKFDEDRKGQEEHEEEGRR